MKTISVELDTDAFDAVFEAGAEDGHLLEYLDTNAHSLYIGGATITSLVQRLVELDAEAVVEGISYATEEFKDALFESVDSDIETMIADISDQFIGNQEIE